MTTKQIVEMANKLNVRPAELAKDLETLNFLSDNFKNMLSQVLLSAGMTVEKDLDSYNDKNEKCLKVKKYDKLLKSLIQQKSIEDDFIGFIYCFLDYPVIEKPVIEI